VSNRSDSRAFKFRNTKCFPKNNLLLLSRKVWNFVIHHPSRTSSTQTGSGQNPLRVKSSILLFPRGRRNFAAQVSSDTHIQPTTTLQAGKERLFVTQSNASCFFLNEFV
jgi:hypothetical protein